MSPYLKNKSPQVAKKRRGQAKEKKYIRRGETHSSSSDFGFEHLVSAFRGCCLRVLEGLVKPLSSVGVRWCLVLTLAQPWINLPKLSAHIFFRFHYLAVLSQERARCEDFLRVCAGQACWSAARRFRRRPSSFRGSNTLFSST
jgi:hypothetical protein